MNEIIIPFHLGREPEIVISDGEGIRLVTAGVVSRIFMISDTNGSRIVLECDDYETILAAGNSTEVINTYRRLESDLLRRPRFAFDLRTAFMSSVITAVVMIGLFAAVERDAVHVPEANIAKIARHLSAPASGVAVPEKPYSLPPGTLPIPPLQPGGATSAPARPTIEEMREALLKNSPPSGQGQPIGATVPLSSAQANALAAGLSGFKAGTQILPRPDFLRLPSPGEPAATPPTSTKAPAAVPAAPAAIAPPPKEEPASAPAAEEAPSLDLDAVTSALDQAGKDAAATLRAAPPQATNELPAAVIKPGTNSVKPEAPTAAAQKPSVTPPAPGAQTTFEAKPAPTTPKVDSKPNDVSQAVPAKPAAEAGGSKVATDPSAKATPLDRKAIAEAVGKVVQGMTHEQAKGIVDQLGKLDGGEITEDMLSGLPHEVAAMLKEAGLVTSAADSEDAPGGVPYRIIRLPEAILEKHRGKDGIADIPGRDTWSATGNFVRLPLPGGGDIKSPDNFKAWGLTP